MPVNLLHLHLRVIHNFIRFHFGSHWTLQLQKTRNHKANTVSQAELQSCLSELPFFKSPILLRSCDTLCTSEQVQVSDDLRQKLTQDLLECCNSAFVLPRKKIASFFSPQTRRLNNSNVTLTNSMDRFEIDEEKTWAYCFLFAREKLVAQCCNAAQNELIELPDEFIYFLKLLVSQYLQEKHESG